MQHRSGGGFDTPIRYIWDYSFYAKRIVSKYGRIFRGQLSDSGIQSKFWIRPVSIKRTNLQKSSTGKAGTHFPTVMSVERSVTKGQSPGYPQSCIQAIEQSIRCDVDDGSTLLNEWMNEYLFHRSFQVITLFHMHQYIELDFPYIWFTQVI